MEDCFALFQHLRARFVFRGHSPTVLSADAVTPFGLPTIFRFARFRVIDNSLALNVLELSRETAQTEKKLAIFPFQPHAVALLRISATINRMLMIPRPLPQAKCRDARPWAKDMHGVIRVGMI